jgi:PPOX class probable F420-dependent enzyme
MDSGEETARRRFAAARSARLATTRPDGRPHVVPIVFAVDGDRIVTVVDDKPKRSADLQRLRNVEAQPEVSVLVDHYEEDWQRLWWARAEGTARVVRGGPEWKAAVRLLQDKYAQYREPRTLGPALVIEVSRWTSWSG